MVGVPAVYPAGVGSVICMLFAVSGPLLVAVIVKVPVPPTFTGVVPVLVMVKMALFVYIFADDTAGDESYSFCAVLVAVLIVVVPAIELPTFPLMVKVALARFASDGIVQTPLL